MEEKMDKQVKLLEEVNDSLLDIEKHLRDIDSNTLGLDTLCDIEGKLDKVVCLLEKQEQATMAEYIWIHPFDEKLISKLKTFSKEQVKKVNQYEDRNEDEDVIVNLPGETIYIARGEGEEAYYLHPVLTFRNPFNRDNSVSVFCDASKDSQSTRDQCGDSMRKIGRLIVRNKFEIEQEFYFNEFDNRRNVLLSTTHVNLGRKVLETFYRACLSAKIPISSANYLNKKEIKYYSYKIGPCNMLAVSDYLWLSRYILQRVSEESNLTVRFDYQENPSNYCYPSTYYYFGIHDRYKEVYCGGRNTRKDYALEFVTNMKSQHHSDIKSYDIENGDKAKKVMLKKFETTDFAESCVKIIDSGLASEYNNCLIKDMRPAGDSNPYKVLNVIISTCTSTLKNYHYL